MVRLFKHYIPHAVLLLGAIDCVLLLTASNLAWVLRAWQIGIDAGPLSARAGALAAITLVVLTAMTAVGVYGSDALRSLRFAGPGCWSPSALRSWRWRSSISCCQARRSGARSCSTRWSCRSRS